MVKALLFALLWCCGLAQAADTVFQNNVTKTDASWFQDVNNFTYRAVIAPGFPITTFVSRLGLPVAASIATFSNNLSAFSSTSSAQLASILSDKTGTGSAVFATSPLLVTPLLGAATATSLTAPRVVGGTATTNQQLELRASSGNSTAGDFINFTGKNNGGTEFGRFSYGSNGAAELLLGGAPLLNVAGFTAFRLNAATAPTFNLMIGGASVAAIYATGAGTFIQDQSTGLPITFITANGPTQFQVTHTANATRNIAITGSNGGNPVISTTAGGLAITSSSGSVPITGTVSVSTLSVSAPVYTDSSKNLTSTAPAGYAATLSGTTSSVGGGALIAGACTSGTVTITGAASGMVAVATPGTYPGDGIYWLAYVSSSNTITVKVCGAVAATPTASTYNVRVTQ